MFSQNKVLSDVATNLPIPHVFELFSFILQWNKHVDDFIKSIVVFAYKFLFDKKVVIMMRKWPMGVEGDSFCPWTLLVEGLHEMDYCQL